MWTARWITDHVFGDMLPHDIYRKELAPDSEKAHDAELYNRHMLARRTFSLDGDLSHSYLDITGDDYYKVYINGRYVGQGPAQSNYFHYYYNRFPVTPYLRQGVNAIAVHVYYHGKICHAYNSGDGRQGFIAELKVGDRMAVKSDHTWKYTITNEYGRGSAIGYDTQFLENIDSRLAERGWRESDFDDSHWYSAMERERDDHRLFLQPTPPLSVYETTPVRASEIGGGGYLLDFGREITGQVRLRAKGGEGQVVEIRCGEELTDNGRVRYEMRCNCTYREYWTLSGREYDELELYDYKAFRYAELLPETGVSLDTRSFSAVVRHYPLDDDASLFETSDSRLDAVWSICRNGVVCGSQETYVDCPSREKGQYLGDNTIITHAHAYIAGDLRLYRKSLHDFALLAMRVCPGFMAVASGSYMQEIADFSLQWPMQLIRYYKHSGDLDFLREMYPIAGNMLRHFETFLREDGLLAQVSDKWNLVDWPEPLRDGYDFDLGPPAGKGCHNVLNAFYYGAMSAVSEIEQILHGACSERLAAQMLRTKSSFRKAFYDKAGKLFVDAEGSEHSSLHANALPLLFGLAPKVAVPSVVAFIRKKRLSCGVYMAYFVLNALAEAGETDLVYELITSDDLHSWGTMLKEGATTCFEVWSKDLKPNASLCHPWASAPIPVLIEQIVGLKPAAPGWKRVAFAPRIPAALHEVKLAFRVPTGRITFEYAGGRMKLEVPEGVPVVRRR
jgi:hypothetical protein